MNLENIEYIQLSLMKKISKIKKNNKATYEKKISCRFSFNEEEKYILKSEEIFLPTILKNMYDDLIFSGSIIIEEVDYLGIWVVYPNDIILENAIKLDTLENMKKYSNDNDINPIYEFFKMTLNNKI